MGYAIEMNFDKGASNKMKKLWTALKYHSICGFMADNGVEPHIALFVLSDDTAKIEAHMTKVIQDFFENEKSFSLDINSIGVFASDANVIYLNPIVTKRMMDIHEKLYEKLVAEGYESYIMDRYKPDKWVPHITMTMNTKETDMVDAIKLLKRKFTELTVSVKSVAFLRFYPVEYKINIQLK